MVELLKQGQYKPFHVTDQIVSIYAGSKGYLDDLPLSKVAEFEEQLLKFIRDEHGDVWQALTDKKAIDDELDSKLQEIMKAFKQRVAPAKQEG
jgi:F-type H+-transporting ATPase subunit alpha